MKRLLVYPYDKESFCIGRYKSLIKEYEVVIGIVPKGSNSPQLKEEVEIEVSDDFEGNAEKCDVVLLLEGNKKINIKSYETKLQWALKNNKEVIVTETLKRWLVQKGLQLEKCSVLGQKKLINNDKGFLSYRTYSITTPVITIYGVGEECNKFNIGLELYKRFKKDGYKVVAIGAKEFAELFGVFQFPKFLYAQDMALATKVRSFSSYIHQIEQSEKPDVIIIAAPSGIMPLCKGEDNYFGELPYIISSAVPADVGILSVYYNQVNEEKFIEELIRYCQYTNDSPIKYINVADVKYDFDDETETVFYLPVNKEKVNRCIEEAQNQWKMKEFKVFNYKNEQAMDKVYSNAIEELSSEVEYMR